MAMPEEEVQDLKSLWAEDWEVMLFTDGSEPFYAITRTEVGVRLSPRAVGIVTYEGIDEFLDAQAMCRRIEEEAGLMLTRNEWCDLLGSLLASDKVMGDGDEFECPECGECSIS